MPRNYVRKTPGRTLISDEQIQRAKKLIQEGRSQRGAAEEVGISEGALRKRLKSTHVPTSLGRFKPTFTKDQEAEFAIHCQEMDNRFFGIKINDLRRLAYEFATANNIKHRFDDSCKMAGRDWVEGFLKRHPNLSLRQSAPVSLARAIGFNETQVRRFYTMLKEVYDQYNFRPNRIYNMDETGMSTVPKKTPKVVSVRGKKVVGKIVSAERGTTITAMMCMSASGHFVPPAFIYPRKRVRPELLDGGPTQSVCIISDSGYVNTKLFVEWLHHFKDFVHPSKEDSVLLIMDNHSSHISLEGANYAREHHIVMLTLPPHGSHKLQPLDVALHSPLKTKYAIECEKWMNQHPGRGITQFHVASLFNVAFKHVATISNAESGFRATGIFPFADDLFDETDFAPSAVTDTFIDQRSTSDNNVVPREECLLNEALYESNENHYLRQHNLNEQLPEPVMDVNISPPESPTIFAIFRNETQDPMVDSDATTLGSDYEGHDIALLDQKSNKENIRVEKNQVGFSNTNISFQAVTVAQLSPLPRMTDKKKKSRVCLKSEIITSSPFKAQLEEKQKLEEEKRLKQSKNTKKRVIFEPQAGPSGIDKKCKKKQKKKIKLKRNEELAFCPICNEIYEDPPIEDWIQCIVCDRWFHENCTAYENGIFRCDFCK